MFPFLIFFLTWPTSSFAKNARIPKASLSKSSLQVIEKTQKTLKPKLEKKLYAQAENPPGSSPFFEKRLHHKTQTNPSPPCHINRECLNQLHNKLLNKKDEDSIHFNCQWAYKNNHLCCKNPTDCFLSYATKEIKEELDDKLKTLVVSQACSQEGISSLNSFLSDFQGDFCEKGVRHCKEFCEHTLRDFQQSFRACFSIKKSVSIDEALSRARQDPLCHREMSKISQIYKELSFDSLSDFYKNLKWESLLGFREALSFEDFVDCERVREGRGDGSFKKLAFSTCQIASTIESGRKLLARAKANREGSEEEENSEENLNDEDSHPVSATGGNFAGGVYQPSALVPTPTKIFPDEGKSLLEEDKKDLSKRELSSIKTPLLKEPLLKSPASSVLEKGLSSTKAIAGKTQANSQLNPQSIKNPQSINKAKTSTPPQAVMGSSSQFFQDFSNKNLVHGYEGIRSFLSSSHNAFFDKTGKKAMGQSQTGKTTKEEPAQDFLEKTWSHTKSLFSSAIKWGTSVGERGKEDLKSVWFSLSGGGPQVVYQSLFQSVEAPQLEPIFVQEVQDKNKKPVFKSYDLLRGKPAGLLVQIKYKKPELCLRLRSPKNCWKRGLSFQLKLKVKDQMLPIRCLSLDAREPFKLPSRPMSEQECFFKSDDFFPPEIFSKIPGDSSPVHKFIEFPTESIEAVELNQYIDRIHPFDTGYSYNSALSLLGFSDRVVKDIDSENSHVPVRINIVEQKEVLLPQMSIFRPFRREKKERTLPNHSVLKSKVPWEKGLGNCERNVEDYFKTKLSSSNVFCINALELLPLKIGWTRIKGMEGAEEVIEVIGSEEVLRVKRAERDNKRCILSEEEAKDNAEIPHWGDSKDGYKMTDMDKVIAFASSDEMRFFIPTVFPISKISSKILRTTKGKDFIMGSCDIAKTALSHLALKQESAKFPGYPPNTYTHLKLYHRYQTHGLLRDLQVLEFERAKARFSKLIAVVPREYFVYHGIQREGPREEEVYGWTPLPHFIQTTGGYLAEFGWGFLGGIAFIREDQLDKGVLSHELAHLLGQRRDFYAQDKDQNKPPQKCRWFSGHPLKICKKHTIPIALKTEFRNGSLIWSFVKKRNSIMDNKNKSEDEESDPKEPLEILWIDRESHQKSFSAMAKISSRFYDSFYHFKRTLFGKNPLATKLLFSVYYSKEKKEFILPWTKFLKTDWSSSSWSEREREQLKVPFLLFQLKSKEGEVLDSVYRPILDGEAGFLSDREKEIYSSKPFGFSMLSAIFDLSRLGDLSGNLQIVVYDPEGQEFFSFSLPED